MTALAASFAPAAMGVSFAAGLLTTLSPCVLPLLPIFVGGAMQNNRSAPMWMGIGMTIAFTVAGTMLGALGPALGVEAGQLHMAAALCLAVFGVALWIDRLAGLVSRIAQPLALSADRLAGSVGHQSPVAALFFGGLLGLAWTPCAGPMLASTLALVASGRDGALGALLLGLFGFGAATPLILAAYASRAGFSRLSGWALLHGRALRRGFGTVAFVSGAFIASGFDRLVATYLLERMPDPWLELVTRF